MSTSPISELLERAKGRIQAVADQGVYRNISDMNLLRLATLDALAATDFDTVRAVMIDLLARRDPIFTTEVVEILMDPYMNHAEWFERARDAGRRFRFERTSHPVWKAEYTPTPHDYIAYLIAEVVAIRLKKQGGWVRPARLQQWPGRRSKSAD